MCTGSYAGCMGRTRLGCGKPREPPTCPCNLGLEILPWPSALLRPACALRGCAEGPGLLCPLASCWISPTGAGQKREGGGRESKVSFLPLGLSVPALRGSGSGCVLLPKAMPPSRQSSRKLLFSADSGNLSVTSSIPLSS